MSLIPDALAHLQESIAAAAGQAVTYIAGTSETAIDVEDAIQGRTIYEADDGTGHKVRAQVTDWLIAPSRLSIDEVLHVPEPGDRIVHGDRTYEVQKLGTEDCWRWSGPSKDRMRIHTREIPTS